MPGYVIAPLSAAAAVAAAVIGAHALERALKTKDEWDAIPLIAFSAFMGIVVVAETLQVLQELGFAK